MNLIHTFILMFPLMTSAAVAGSGGPGSAHPTLPKNQSCASCNLKDQAVLKPGFGGTVGALETATAEELYERIKAKYLASGKCHRYSFLPQSDQNEFMLTQFGTELRTFTENVPQMSDHQALESLISAMGLSADEANSLNAEFAALPAKIAYSNTQTARSKFQATLMQKMTAHLQSDPLKSLVATRVAATLAKNGIDEDCDFISKTAFVEAYNAKKGLSVHLNKPNLLSIVDRSLSKSSRRFMVLDLANESVLFHSTAGFGDGDHNDHTVGEESNTCSNHSGGNDSPYGLAITSNTRAANGGAGFPGLGTMLKTQAANYPAGGFQDRGIAVHIAGSGMFSNYPVSENDDQRPGDKLNRVLAGDSSSDAVNAALWGGGVMAPRAGTTNGCIGLPPEQLADIQQTIQNGSAVYFYCTPNMKR